MTNYNTEMGDVAKLAMIIQGSYLLQYKPRGGGVYRTLYESDNARAKQEVWVCKAT